MIAAVDDATSDMPYREFFKTESLAGVMRVVRKIIELKGILWGLYLNRAEWFAGFRKSDQTQFKRICKELGITIIPLYSPQGKGRIEHAWSTLQGRLVAELGLYQIKTMNEANEYLNQKFIPETWRTKMTVAPESSEYLYKPVSIHQSLDPIFCLKFRRKVRSDHTIQYRNDRYQITIKLPYSIARRIVEIREKPDGTIEAWINERNLQLERLTNIYSNRYAS